MPNTDDIDRRLRRTYINRLMDRIAHLAELRPGLTIRDEKSVREAKSIAHQLAGSGASYGFEEITRSARAFEYAVEADDVQAFDEMVDVLYKATKADSIPPNRSGSR